MKSKKENSKFQKILEKYNYSLPPELIAQEPASPRDTARLLICTKICAKKDVNKKSKVKERWEVKLDTFLNLTKYLPSKSVLVFNDTKVLPARLTLIKPTSGKVNVLYTEKDKNLIKVMADRKLEIGWKLTLNSKIHFLVCKQSEKYYI
jgi:S-adenosylmethionine:tRNA-ribosyltransferase-isomerase (queuine synthetase)